MKTNSRKQKLKEFLIYFQKYITGNEKGEGQIFFEHLLQAFGNAGIKEVGATCEELIKKRKGKRGFADFIWEPRVIIELKKRGENLQKYYDQAFDYWIHRIPRLKYTVLCNFDDFWIYDFNQQLHDPVHKLEIKDLPDNWGPLAFLFPKEEKPIFDNYNIKVTEEVAGKVGHIYYSLIKRNVDAKVAQKFILQIVVALFSEDVGLIPKYTVQKILLGIVKKQIDQEELKKLLQSMAFENITDKPKNYKKIPFFNGGLFDRVDLVELNHKEIHLIYEASAENWGKVRPSIFGSIFESSMEKDLRHGHGIHYTSELDIQKIVYPTIVQPFKEKIKKSKSKRDLKKILLEIRDFKVLDPACGSGNFLYVAFRELRNLEVELLEELGENLKQMRSFAVSPKNFYGIDTNEFGLELAKVALSIGRKMSADECNVHDPSLPFDDLESNFSSEDALFAKWPEVSAIIGNPPFLSSKKMKIKLPVEYVNKVRKQFKDVPGRADYCVYWLRKAHDNLKNGQRAGFVGTNTIRENYSREGGLDYIVKNEGTITSAVSTQVWSGEAHVHVSIVNWIKGKVQGKKKLFTQLGNKVTSPWKIETPKKINSSLSSKISVKDAYTLKVNRKPKKCFQGQITGSSGFYLSKEKYKIYIKKNKKNSEVIFPLFVGRDLLGNKRIPERFVIDFGQMSILEAKRYKEPFQHIKNTVLLDVKNKAENEIKKHGKPKDWNAHLNHWWRHWRNRPDLLKAIRNINKYIAVPRVSSQPVFEFVSNKIHSNDLIITFPFEDNYSFGILHSCFHFEWIKARCSTLAHAYRYTGDTVFSTFPWPQNPTKSQIQKISFAVQNLMQIRRDTMLKNNWGLRELYNTLGDTGKNPLKSAHERLDDLVRQAYGMKKNRDTLKFLLNLNTELHAKEKKGQQVIAPGLPPSVKNPKEFISKYCITPSKNY